jgi:hypothetical protein
VDRRGAEGEYLGASNIGRGRAGHVAQQSGGQDAALSPFVPPDDAGNTDTIWWRRPHFRGTVIVGRDLLEIGGCVEPGLVTPRG